MNQTSTLAILPFRQSVATAAVLGARPGTRVAVPPGKTYVPVPPECTEPLGIAELVPAGDGTFRLMARICPREFKVTPSDLRRLQIPISRMTMMRLIAAGFVSGRQATPGLMLFDFHSWERHLAAVAADTEFWDRTQPGHLVSNRERYRRAL